MKGAHYFPHDNNARGDEKIIHLMSALGWEGYGLYWGLIEKLHEAGGWIKEDCTLIAFDLRTESDRIKKILHDFGLFVFNNGRFTSQRVLSNITVRTEKVEKARISASKRWERNANAMRTQCEPNAINEIKVNEMKLNERKGKERKLKETKTLGHFQKPSAMEVEEYALSIGFKLVGQKFLDHYESNGWKVGRNKMVSWKATVRNWKAREAERGQQGNRGRGTQPNREASQESIDKFSGITERIEL